MITFQELTDSSADIQRLTEFYDSIYVAEFPDPDERESLSNMIEYLKRRAQGWYGPNNYHILLAHENGRPIGGSITDYLAEPNVGVIEFLVVAASARQSGVGRRLLTKTEQLLDADADRFTGGPLAAVLAEINDPLAPAHVQDNLDPTTRTLIWDRWGYAGLDFPYVQPALSAEQRSVHNLMLIVRSANPNWRAGLPAQTIRLATHAYLQWACRIERPDTCPAYQRMAEYLNTRDTVATIALRRYVGCDAARPLHIVEVTGTDHADFAPIMTTYREMFNGPLAVPEREFRNALAAGGGYHLWSVRAAATDPVEGFASFFALRTGGFGGYLALTGGLRGTGRLRALIARIERQLWRDRPDTTGWYIEVGYHTDPRPFAAIGFVQLDVDYRQPGGDRPDIPIRLMFKPYGRCYGPPRLSPAAVLDAIEEIYVEVYAIPVGRRHRAYRAAEASLAGISGNVPLISCAAL